MAGMARMPKTDEERRDAVKKRWKEERKKRDKVLGILKEIQENVR
jgi:NADH:ubiquinone oxidoreductase subunit E